MKIVLKKIKSVLIISVILVSFMGTKASAQFFTGGDLNVTFINGVNIDIAPIFGYKYQNFSAGISPVVMYTATGDLYGEVSYGGRVFFEYDVFKGAFIHAEFMALNTGYLNTALQRLRNWAMGAPIGAGYQYEISKNVWFKGMVLYDALLDIDLNQSSPQANPSVRGGITYVF